MNERRPLSSPSIRPRDERRGLARYPFDLDAVCRQTGGPARDAEPGKVCNISAHGLGLTLARRFIEGSEISLDLHDTPQSVAGTLHVRVMNVRETEPGRWLHGCAFVSHRAGEDMQAAFRAKLARPPGRERRTLLRYPFVAPATGRALTAAVTDTWAGTTHDISAGGLRIAAAVPVSVGTLLTVKIQADGSAGSRTLMARVVHASAAGASPYQLGCMFPTRLPPAELHALLKEAWSRSRTKPKGPLDHRAALKLALADQIERNLLTEARATVAELLRLRPNDPDATAAREFLDSLELPTAEARCFKGHKACVNAVTFYANGRFAASGGGVDDELERDVDHSIRFWDLGAGFEVHCYAGHRSPICGIAVPLRGTRALTASRCGMLLLWDMERRTVIRQFEAHGRGTNCVAISAAGKWALTGCDDALLRLWDNDLGRCLRRFNGHEGPITACAFLGDDHTAVSAGMDRTLRIWTLGATQRQTTLTGHTKGVLCLAVSTDGRRVASGSADNTVRIWDVATNAEVFRLEGHENVVNAVAFSPDGTRIASASADNTVRLWDARKGTELGCFTGHTQSVKCVAFAPDGCQLLSAGSDQSVRLWDVAAAPK